MALPGGEVERGLSEQAGAIDGGARVGEQQHDLRVALVGGLDQRAAALRVDGVDIGAASQQQAHDLGVSAERRRDERGGDPSCARVLLIDLRAGVEQRGDAGPVALGGRVPQRRLGRRLVVGFGLAAADDLPLRGHHRVDRGLLLGVVDDRRGQPVERGGGVGQRAGVPGLGTVPVQLTHARAEQIPATGLGRVLDQEARERGVMTELVASHQQRAHRAGALQCRVEVGQRHAQREALLAEPYQLLGVLADDRTLGADRVHPGPVHRLDVVVAAVLVGAQQGVGLVGAVRGVERLEQRIERPAGLLARGVRLCQQLGVQHLCFGDGLVQLVLGQLAPQGIHTPRKNFSLHAPLRMIPSAPGREGPSGSVTRRRG